MKRILFTGTIRRCLYSRLVGNKLFMLFSLLLFSGIVTGAVCSRTADELLMKRLDIIFQTNFELRCAQGAFSAFVSSFASSMIFMAVLLMLGLSVWGGLFSAVIPFFKGYGYGLAVGFLYGSYGAGGVFYNILVILPGMFLSAAVIAYAATLSLRNSLYITACFKRTPLNDDPHALMKGYLLSMLRCLALCALSSIVDMLCSLCFSRIFHFN